MQYTPGAASRMTANANLVGSVVIVLINMDLKWTAALPYENEYGPDYGEEWLYYLSDNGTNYIMNFSTLPSDSRGLLFGEAYFHLYTRKNYLDPELLEIPNNSSTMNSRYFNATNNVKVVTHGWLSNDDVDWIQNIKDQLLKIIDVNVITIDWSELAQNPIYPWPALSTRYVGKRLGKLLDALLKSYDVGGQRMHLIGHSLGAHVMGYGGMFFSEKVHRITGLDPARPMFELPPMGDDFRLEKSDAEFVDIIHTCGGIFGYKNSHGHADFYPNNGKPKQPGCEGRQQVIEACSHGRAHDYFEESIGSDIGFKAYYCESWEKFENNECTEKLAYMGFPADDVPLGDYYLHTRNESKFAAD